MNKPVSLISEDLINKILIYFHGIAEASGTDVKSAVNEGTINPEIEIDNGFVFGGPNATTDGKIILNEMHLTYLWSISYFLLFLQEELNKEQISNGETGSFDLTKSSERTNAVDVLNWALSLRTRYTPWPNSLPNPNDVTSISKLEAFYVEKANIIFCRASCFLIYHEFAHIILNHDPSNGNPYSKDQEKEADEYARSVLLWAEQEKHDWYSSVFGVVVATMSILFSKVGTLCLSSSTHPNVDLRVEHTFTYIDSINNEHDKEWCKQIILNGCNLYLQSIDVVTPVSGLTQDIDSGFDRILEVFNSIHDSIHS